MYNLSEWHRGTPTVPPVGAVNVPPKIWKIQKIHVFDDFGGDVFLIKFTLYRIFIKICVSKKFNRFFHRKHRTFFEIFHFPFFSYISSPISESFIAQLLLPRALDQKVYFCYTYSGNPWDFPYQLSANALYGGGKADFPKKRHRWSTVTFASSARFWSF